MDRTESDKVNAVIDLPNGLANKIDHDENRTQPSPPISDHANHSQLNNKERPPPPPVSPTRKYQSTLKTNNPVAENTLVLGGVAPQPLPIPDSGDEPKPVVPLNASQANGKSSLLSLLYAELDDFL